MSYDPQKVRVAILGDSLSNFYPAELRDMLGKGWDVANFSVGGADTIRCRTFWSRSVQGWGFHAVVCMGGINNLTNVAPDVAASFSPLQDIYNETQTEGLKVIALKLLPASSASTVNQAGWASFNSLVAGITNPHVSVLDINADYGTAAALTPNWYLSDGIHISGAAITNLATRVKDRLKSLYPGH